MSRTITVELINAYAAEAKLLLDTQHTERTQSSDVVNHAAAFGARTGANVKFSSDTIGSTVKAHGGSSPSVVGAAVNAFNGGVVPGACPFGKHDFKTDLAKQYHSNTFRLFNTAGAADPERLSEFARLADSEGYVDLAPLLARREDYFKANKTDPRTGKTASWFQGKCDGVAMDAAYRKTFEMLASRYTDNGEPRAHYKLVALFFEDTEACFAVSDRLKREGYFADKPKTKTFCCC